MDKINLDELGMTMTIMDERTSNTYEFHIIDYSEITELLEGNDANRWFFEGAKIEDLVKEKQNLIDFFLPTEDIKWVCLNEFFDQVNFSKMFTSSVNEGKFTIVIENHTEYHEASVVSLMLKNLS